MKKTITILGICVCTGNIIHAQKWVTMMQDPTVNFYTVQKEFNEYWEKRAPEEKEKDLDMDEESGENEIPNYSLYKRWEAYMEPRVYPSGNRLSLESFKEERAVTHMPALGNWTQIGPTMLPSQGGVGRVNAVRLHPANANTIFACAASGGLWQSNNGGSSWFTTTDHLGIVGCSDLAFDPSNPDVMYLATGDGDGGDAKSVGIVKSIDGGATWSKTGLTWTLAQQRQISKIIINPNNSSILMAATSNGIWRSTDAGVTWGNPSGITSSFKALVFKPGDPNTVYAAGTDIYRSTDNGLTFTKLTTGLPASGKCNRYSLAVAPSNPSYLFALGSSASTSGSLGVYRSTDSGNTFSTLSTTPNLLGGQGWYDNCIAVNPTNKNELIAGGVDLYKSTDGGSTWTKNANTAFGSGCHGDFHDVIYAGSSYYVGTDGGVSKTTDGGNKYTDLSSGMMTALIYGFGQSATTPYLTLSGWQDNGFVKSSGSNGTIWARLGGGDGCLSFIDWSDDKKMYTSNTGGNLTYSSNGGVNFSGINGNINESGSWITPWCQDPVNASTIYAGFKNLWKSTNNGTAWTKISSFSWGNIVQFAVAKSNPLVIYATDGKTLQKTTNGGTSWATISSGLPTSASISYIAIDNKNPDKAWITYSGYSATTKVFATKNGGTNWTNITFSLPNIPVNCIVKNHSTSDDIFIGTDNSVYLFNSLTSDWVPFTNGLPDMQITQLDINYALNKIRASSKGRGLWESSVSTITAIADHDAEENKVGIYPNPTTGIITLDLTGIANEDVNIKVTDLSGRILFEGNSNGTRTFAIDMSTFQADVYFTILKGKNLQIVKKIIKE